MKRSTSDGEADTQSTPSNTRMRVDTETPKTDTPTYRYLAFLSTFKDPASIGRDAACLLPDLANGRVPDQFDELQGNELVQSLLARGEFAALVAVFNAYQDILEQNALQEGRPYKRVLKLDMRDMGWSPQDVERCCNAFKEVRVDRLEVGSMDLKPDAGQPDAICQAIAALLKTQKPTELAINGALASPQLVADALADSHLSSIEMLTGTSHTDFAHPEAVATCETLADALPGCLGLKHLTLGEWKLVALSPKLENLAKSDWSRSACGPTSPFVHPTRPC